MANDKVPRTYIPARPAEVEKVVRMMSPADQKDLERRIWAMRMDGIVSKMRKNARRNRITQKQIEEMSDDARKLTYEKRRR